MEKKGITPSEERLKGAFRVMGLTPITDMAVCFRCGVMFGIERGHYPEYCARCRWVFQKGDYCLPDIILHDHNGQKSVIFVNGKVHGQTRRRKKDLYQIQQLQHLGFKIFVVTNDAIDSLIDTNLRCLALGLNIASNNPSLYYTCIKGDKELY